MRLRVWVEGGGQGLRLRVWVEAGFEAKGLG